MPEQGIVKCWLDIAQADAFGEIEYQLFCRSHPNPK